MHWQRWRRTGGPLIRKVDLPSDLDRKYWERLVVGSLAKHHPELGNCYDWTGSKDSNGYGSFYIGGPARTYRPAHLWAYERFVGPVPDGLELDHFACDNRACARLDHVKPVTKRENTLRSETNPTAINARKTHCIRGHEFTPENTRSPVKGGRICRECERAYQREWARRKRAAQRKGRAA